MCQCVYAHCACGLDVRSKCQKMGTAGLIVGAKRTNTWLVKTLLYMLSIYLWTLSLLLSWLLRWTTSLLFFLRVTSRRLHSALVSVLDSAKYIHCKAQSCCPLCFPLHSLSTSLCNTRFSDAWILSMSANWHSKCESKLTFLSMAPIDIPKCDHHVCTYVHTYIRMSR